MATAEVGPAPAGRGAESCANMHGQEGKTERREQPGAQQAQGDAPAPKKLSNAELKKRAKEEKAARRAQAKAAQAPAGGGGSASSPAAPHADSADAKAKARSKQDGHQSHGQPQQQQQQQHHAKPAPPKEKVPEVPRCFSHLSMARRLDMAHADKDVHPVVLALGQYMATFAISHSITRLEATLLAFKKVIDSYQTPHGTSFSRHFTSHVLNPQIDYLTACRPMCFSMGNAIRWLKLQVSKVDIDLPDVKAKSQLSDAIDNFIRERISLADLVIVRTAAESIRTGQVILTYAHHPLVERALLKARTHGRSFSVVVVDDAFERVGLHHARRLSAAGIPVTYAPDLGALRTNLQDSSHVLLGSEAVFSNGAVYARAGTCDIATAAKDAGKRVVALCETINFTDRASTNSLTYNEIDPERCSEGGFRLLFDTTTDRSISAIITELGNTSTPSVPAILRKLEEL